MDKVPSLPAIRRVADSEYIFLSPALLSELTDENLFGVRRVDIRFSPRRYRRTGGYLPKIVRKKVAPIGTMVKERTMDIAISDSLDFPDDAIDKVARANSVKVESAAILPEVRASPCPIHNKHDKKSDLMYMSTHHAGSMPAHGTKGGKMRRVISNSSMDNDFAANRDTKEDLTLDRRAMNRSSLPANMPSKEFVMTWLMYGSEPGSGNHFPELVKSESIKKTKNKQGYRKGTTKDFSFGE